MSFMFEDGAMSLPSHWQFNWAPPIVLFNDYNEQQQQQKEIRKKQKIIISSLESASWSSCKNMRIFIYADECMNKKNFVMISKWNASNKWIIFRNIFINNSLKCCYYEVKT